MRGWWLVVLLAAPIASQAQMPERLRLLTSSRYAELERLGEKEIEGDPKPTSAKLMPLCAAYTKLKRYNKVFSCLDRLELNIGSGDVGTQSLEEIGKVYQQALEELRRSNPLMRTIPIPRFDPATIGGEAQARGTVVPFYHMMRAEIFNELRDYEKAVAAGESAVASIPRGWKAEVNYEVMTLGALGLAQALAGKNAEARTTAERLSAVNTAPPLQLVTPQKWLGVVRILVALRDFKAAHQILLREKPSAENAYASLAAVPLVKLELGTSLGMKEGQSLSAWIDIPLRFLTHKTQLEVGEVGEAKQGFDKLLATPEIRDNGEIYWLLLYDRGRIAAAEGDLPAAIEYWRRAIEVIEQQRSTINTETNKIGFVGDKQAVYRALVAALFAQTRHAEAFDYVERSKARALVDLLAGKKDFSVAAPNAEEIKKLLAGAEQQEIDSLAQAAASGQRSLVAIQDLKAQAPELASLISVSSVPLAEIQAGLPEDEALVEYYYDDKALFAFVLTRAGLQGRRLDAADLEADVRALRQAIENRGAEYRSVGQRLYRRLLAPLHELIPGRKLLIVPHGALHYLPFAALHDGSGFLLDRYSIRFLPSASVIRYLRAARPEAQAGVLAFGNPDLGDPRFDLKFAQEEAIAVAQSMPQSRALVRKEATESAFRRYAAGFGALHFATHGEFNGDAPLRSALLLARDGDSDGLLTVGKLYSIRITADLVTLSACETALGKIASGDDVVGLTRGFLYAGASTVVASLWKVDDRATSALMTRFYGELKAGDKREALRKAQLATRAEFPHPFFWAPFQLTGRAN